MKTIEEEEEEDDLVKWKIQEIISITKKEYLKLVTEHKNTCKIKKS